MPCYDPRGNEPKTVYETGISPEYLESEVSKREQKISFLEAGLCAIITELEKRNLAEEIIPEASRKGLIDLVGFWNYHKKDDESRLMVELHKFSIHEQEVLREILNKTTKK